MPQSVLVPITNVYAKGDYTAEVRIGSREQPANLILDSGSSTLVVQTQGYDPARDEALVATEYAQDIVYGLGGWYGPVVKTRVKIGVGAYQALLADAHVAVAKKEQTGCFGESDGLLGLAYRELNDAYNIAAYLKENSIDPAVSYPWYLEQEQQDDTVREFRTFLRQYPHEEITPYFTQLEQQGVVGNQFAFIIHRSSIYQTESKKTTAQLKQHPLNNGIFIMGCPRIHEHLYQGEFLSLKVVGDKYYNVQLKSMQVGNCDPVTAPELAPKDVKGYVSNAIIDSGASMIILPELLFGTLFDDLIKINRTFESLLEPFRTFEGVEKGIPMQQVVLEDWPDLHFTFEGFDGETITLTMTPETYWQTHAPVSNQISFQFVYLPTWPNQAVMGLPLMNNYFTIFDRTVRKNGAVRVAKKSFEPHRLGEVMHRKTAALKDLFHTKKHNLSG